MEGRQEVVRPFSGIPAIVRTLTVSFLHYNQCHVVLTGCTGCTIVLFSLNTVYHLCYLPAKVEPAFLPWPMKVFVMTTWSNLLYHLVSDQEFLRDTCSLKVLSDSDVDYLDNQKNLPSSLWWRYSQRYLIFESTFAQWWWLLGPSYYTILSLIKILSKILGL